VQLRCMRRRRWRDYKLERTRTRSLVMRMVVMLMTRRHGCRRAAARVCRTCCNALDLGKQNCRYYGNDKFRRRHYDLRSRAYHDSENSLSSNSPSDTGNKPWASRPRRFRQMLKWRGVARRSVLRLRARENKRRNCCELLRKSRVEIDSMRTPSP
jgi:hypothetical protein